LFCLPSILSNIEAIGKDKRFFDLKVATLQIVQWDRIAMTRKNGTIVPFT